MGENCCDVQKHPSYSPDLQPSDKNVFGALKEGLAGIQLVYRNSVSTIFEYEMRRHLRMSDFREVAKLSEHCRTEDEEQEYYIL